MKQKSFLISFFLFFSTYSFSQTNDKLDCKFLRHSTLKILEIPDTTAYVVINDTNHIEYFSGEKYYIKSKLLWLNECEYNMTMVEITLPNFPFHPGDMMNVKFDSIEGEIIYFTANVKGEVLKGKFKLVK